MSEPTKVGFPSTAYSQATDASAKRAYAVSAALELIAVRVLNNTTGGVLKLELDNLSAYADTIQAALDKK
ncbi:hypothetical protein [Pseudomonas marginalis]|uniref:hypothetical protein n=1 Tax=Pseudomonas marginalis TaxID=298 RepID=UPI002A364B16|nr:hypothetical protein [Pseudomonas marginalis]WPN21824.1 hypothetical protein QMK57_20725 [Pseudomonas marginalis]